MNPFFNEIADSEATNLVSGRKSIKSSDFLSVNAEAFAKSFANTEFFKTGYPQTYTNTFTKLDDVTSYSESTSLASIFYSDDPTALCI